MNDGVRRYVIWLEWPEKCFRVNAEALAYLRKAVPPKSVIKRVRTAAEFLKELPLATHVIVWSFREEWFSLAPNLKVLATPGAGRELVSIKAPKGVKVHFGGFHGRIMAESVAAFMLAWARGFYQIERRTPTGMRWPRTWLSDKCTMVRGSKAVIVGYGRVGRAIGEFLEKLGVEIFGYSRSAKISAAEYRRRLKAADWLIMALPSDTGTDDYLNAKLIQRLSRKCVVINVGRGNAVDERALLSALKKGLIAGAYLDVFKGETTLFRDVTQPKSANKGVQVLARARAKLPWNLVTMPHAAAFTADYVLACFKELKDEGII